MRKFVLFVLIIAALGYWLSDFVRGGGFERFLDAHPNQTVNPKIEYYWGVLLDLSERDESSRYRMRRVLEKYPDSPFAAEAWSTLIDSLSNGRKKKEAMEECGKFLETYPDHPKAELVRKKLGILQHGLF